MNMATYHLLFKIKTHILHLKAQKVTNELKSASQEQMCKSNIIPELNKEATAHKMTGLQQSKAVYSWVDQQSLPNAN